MLRSWDLNLHITKSSGVVVYLQIAQQIIDEIQRGRLVPSAAMPGSRELAESLKVNRKTIVLAYDELIAQGWLTTESRRGTFVSAKLPHFLPLSQSSKALKQHVTEMPTSALAKYASTMNGENITHFVDFNDGLPETRRSACERMCIAFRRAVFGPIRANNKKNK